MQTVYFNGKQIDLTVSTLQRLVSLQRTAGAAGAGEATATLNRLAVRLCYCTANTLCFVNMLTCVCVREKAWLAARVSPRLARMPRLVAQGAHVACFPRLRQSQSLCACSRSV